MEEWCGRGGGWLVRCKNEYDRRRRETEFGAGAGVVRTQRGGCEGAVGAVGGLVAFEAGGGGDVESAGVFGDGADRVVGGGFGEFGFEFDGDGDVGVGEGDDGSAEALGLILDEALITGLAAGAVGVQALPAWDGFRPTDGGVGWQGSGEAVGADDADDLGFGGFAGGGVIGRVEAEAFAEGFEAGDQHRAL